MKAVVMEIRNDTCVVLQSDGAFAEIKNRNYRVGQGIRMQPKLTPCLAVVACFLLLCTAAIGWHIPTSYVYMDINPSLLLEVNCLNRVISTVALNEDAKNLLKETGLLTGKTDECMEQLVTQCRALGYIPEGGADLELHLRTNKQTLEQQVQKIAQSLEGRDLTVSLYAVDPAEHKAALRSGVSPKRLEAVKQYTDQFGGTLEGNMSQLQGVATNEILRQIREAGGQLPADRTVRYVSPQRKHAVHSYTQQFGGTLEENMEKLRGLTLEEIHQLIREDRNP